MKPAYLVEARSVQGKATEDFSNPLETGPHLVALSHLLQSTKESVVSY